MTSPVLNQALNPTPTTEACHAIVFEASDRLLALPLSAISKITARSSPLVRFVDQAGFLYLGEQLVTVLDLDCLLAQSNAPRTLSKQSSPPFLIIAQAQPQSVCAIPVSKPPNLIELNLSNLRSLPPHTAQAMDNIVSHVAVLPGTAGKLTTIFLLNLSQALTMLHSKQSLSKQSLKDGLKSVSAQKTPQ